MVWENLTKTPLSFQDKLKQVLVVFYGFFCLAVISEDKLKKARS